jgi:hypothetical protein
MVQHVTDVVHRQKRIGMDRLVRARQVHPNMPVPVHVRVLRAKQTKVVCVRHRYIQHVKHIVKTEIQRRHLQLVKHVVVSQH